MLYIEKKNGGPVYEQIYAYYVKEILSGSLDAGERLPATRDLAQQLSISRNTVDRAYQQLMAEGYIYSKQGSGFYINGIPQGPVADEGSADAAKGRAWAAGQAAAGNISGASGRRHPDAGQESVIRYDFAYGPMDNGTFPYKLWRKCINDALAKCEAETVIPYPHRMGEPELQRALCRYLHRSRGVNCRPEQILITCGQQHSMEIIANMLDSRHDDGGPADSGQDGSGERPAVRALCRPPKRFAMEEPGYDGIRVVFKNHGYELCPVPVEEDGISLEVLQQAAPDILYVTPAHQFPTGAVLPVAKRKKLLAWAQETDAYIIEDDYDSELRYYTNPIPAMQSLDPYQRTIYTGTFSKSFSPSTRLAYIVLPEALLELYYRYYHRYNVQVTRWHQLALAEFVESGHYERHINRLRTLYRKKQAALIEAIKGVFGERIAIFGGGAGIHLLLDVKGALSQEELIARAASIGIRLHSTKVLYIDETNCPKSQLLLGFPTISEGAFRRIMEELKAVWEM